MRLDLGRLVLPSPFASWFFGFQLLHYLFSFIITIPQGVYKIGH
ncbi:unnamed protein product [Acidithrix sp. C25]|nr:unnamed protein product [Acidithrix sp. C25]